jgi:hypothetical protein
MFRYNILNTVKEFSDHNSLQIVIELKIPQSFEMQKR